MSRACVLTYDAPHRKTADLLTTLAAQGERGIDLVVLPWRERVARAAPLIPHRPGPLLDVPPAALAERLGMGVRHSTVDRLAGDLAAGGYRAALIGGAGILAPDVVAACRCINAHPGYLPHVRGLDALKWAVLEGLPIGVTTHVVDRAVDAGTLVRRELVPIHASDTFHAVAYRQYEMEVQLLAAALRDVDGGCDGEPLDTRYPVRGRVPPPLELVLLRRFEARVTSATINGPGGPIPAPGEPPSRAVSRAS